MSEPFPVLILKSFVKNLCFLFGKTHLRKHLSHYFSSNISFKVYSYLSKRQTRARWFNYWFTPQKPATNQGCARLKPDTWSLLMVWESSWGWPKICTLMGDLEEAPSSWVWTSPAPAVMTTWEVKQQIDLSLFLYVSFSVSNSALQIKKNTY